MKRIYFKLTFLLLFITKIGVAQQINEILGRPTDSSITVNVLFSSQVDAYFEYGTTQGNYTNTTPVVTSSMGIPVEVKFTELLPSTRYYYRTRYRNVGGTTYNAGNMHTFITQRKKGSTFRFAIEADPHPYDKKCYAPLWDICLNNQLNDTADFMIDLGDTFGDDHFPTTITSEQVKQLQLNCRDFFGKVCHSLPFFFCLGNHEGESGYYLLQTPPNNLAVYETLWRKLFYSNPAPDNFYTGCNIEEGYGMGKPENYYAWEWGDALFVVLDVYRYATASEKPQKWDFTIGKTQYDWFKQTLQNSNAKFKFVFAHHILGQGRGGIELAKSFEWGGYDAGVYKFDTYRPGWGLPLHQLMQQYNVDIFFQGHDHIYVHQELDGITYQSCPMPSDSSYKIGVTDNGSAYISGKQLAGSGHIRVSVTSDSVNVDYVNALLPKDETLSFKNRDVLDSYTIKKSGNSALNDNFADVPSWKIYPNPASEKFNLWLSSKIANAERIEIYTLDGKLVKSKMLSDIKEYCIDLTNDNLTKLKPGMYLVKLVYSKNKSLIKKIIVNTD